MQSALAQLAYLKRGKHSGWERSCCKNSPSDAAAGLYLLASQPLLAIKSRPCLYLKSTRKTPFRSDFDDEELDQLLTPFKTMDSTCKGFCALDKAKEVADEMRHRKYGVPQAVVDVACVANTKFNAEVCRCTGLAQSVDT